MSISINSSILSIADSIAIRFDEPIPLIEVAEEEFINVICDDYGSSSFDGLTWFEPDTDDFYIHLNTNQLKKNFPNKPKGRFTLAHELGHYFIPSHRLGLMRGLMKPHGSVNYLTDRGTWTIEREADAFASALLMPLNSVREFVRRKPFCFELIEDIASKYNVSKSAAALRFVDIGNCPIMVVFAVDGKIRWVSHSEDFPFRRLKYGSGRGDKVPENTVMGTYFYEKDNSDCQNEEIVYARDCFQTRNKEENENEFLEWCIDFKNSALSVFWENT